ncbi:MAG: hypothetical protein RL711_988 [Bacteroidota bacterium]
MIFPQHAYQLLLNPSTKPKLSFEPWLFNTERYYKQWQVKTHVFYWFNQDSGLADGLFVLQENDLGEWISAARATFGGIDGLASLDVDPFIQAIQKALSALNILKFKIKMCPLYDGLVFLPAYKQGFAQCHVAYTELNYHFSIKFTAFKTQLHTSKRWRLNKLKKMGFVFETLQSPDLLAIHQFIAKARNRKGYPMTSTAEAFCRMVTQLEDCYTIFAVKKDEVLLAVAVCVNLGKGVLYNFYSADADTCSADSPMVLLYEGMYQYAQKKGFRILDLGIATYLGERNEGLIHFKKSIGAIETEKQVIEILLL